MPEGEKLPDPPVPTIKSINLVGDVHIRFTNMMKVPPNITLIGNHNQTEFDLRKAEIMERRAAEAARKADEEEALEALEKASSPSRRQRRRLADTKDEAEQEKFNVYDEVIKVSVHPNET